MPLFLKQQTRVLAGNRFNLVLYRLKSVPALARAGNSI